MHLYTVAANMLRLLFLVLISVVCADLETAVRIRISSGEIEGKYVYSRAINKSYFSFRGIPFAEPPLGELRFLPPVRPKPWDGVLVTKEDGPRCTQRTGGGEDCLHLNVFTPTVPCSEDSSDLLPVMVYFFGGMWIIGSDTKVTYTPDFLIDKNVILVTCNYRLNVFGYLNAMQETAPGNVGLKDQVAVLEWVQENIEKFGGNPKQVTIFGHSSGSECIQYHLQSPLSRGLFHRAIMQSGSSLNNMALERNPIEVLHILGQVLNMNTDNVTAFVENLRQIPARDLFLAADNARLLNNRQSIDRARFTPSIEYTRKNAFIPESSYSTLERRIIHSIPVMIGQTSNEAGFFQDPDFRSYFTFNLTTYLVDPTLLLPKSLNINLTDTVTVNAVLDEIHHKFFNNKSLPWNVSFSNYETDEEYIRGIIKTVEFLRRDNPIYYYVFGYKYIGERTVYQGVAHVGELRYLWNAPEFNNGETETDDQRVVREKMTTLWTNFARTGDPTPYKDGKLDNVMWPRLPTYIADGNPYIYIGGKLEIRENPWNHYEFWERIFNTYGRRPFLLY